MVSHARKTLQRVFTLLGIIGLAVVVYVDRKDLGKFWSLIEHLRWYVLGAIVVVQLGSYWLNAFYYRSILRVFSYAAPPLRLFEGALAANFVNYVLPSAGLAGAGYLSQVLAPEVPRGASVLVQLMRYALSAIAVLVMMPVGIALLTLNRTTGRSGIIDTSLWASTAITLGGVALLLLVQREKLLRALVERLMNVFKRFFSPKRRELVWGFVDQFYEAFRSMGANVIRMWVPFAWSILYILVEIGTLYMVFLAFGRVENPGIVVMAYLFANIASVLGGVFFSIGVFEVGMAGTLVALGMGLVLAASVTTVYRITNLVIGLPPGFLYYRKYLARERAAGGLQNG